jgi:hypothetical protein
LSLDVEKEVLVRWLGIAMALVFCQVWMAGHVFAQAVISNAATQPVQPTPSEPAARLPWASLTPAQQVALQPLKEEWPQMGAFHQKKWLAVAYQFGSLSEPNQIRIQGRMAQWAKLSTQERGQARSNYQQAQQLSAQQRALKWQAYQSLSPEQRADLTTKSKANQAENGQTTMLQNREVPAQVLSLETGRRGATTPKFRRFGQA